MHNLIVCFVKYNGGRFMGKISTMQKLFGLCLLLSLFPLAIGGYGVTSLQKLTFDLNTLYNVHMKGLDQTRALNITVLSIVRDEKNLIISDDEQEIEKYGSSSFDVEFMKPLRPESGPQSGRPW